MIEEANLRTFFFFEFAGYGVRGSLIVHEKILYYIISLKKI
jgi:hypothetical protein